MQEPMPLVPPPELKARVARAVEGAKPDPTPVRVRVTFAIVTLPLLAIAVLLARKAFFGTTPLRIDLDTLAWLPLVTRVGCLVAWTAAVTVIAVRMGRGGLGSSARALSVVAISAAPVYALATLIAPDRSDDPAACDAVSALSPFGWKCAVVATLVGSLALIVLVRALRGSVPTAPHRRGAALGAAAGLWGGLSLVMHCPASSAAHLLVGHVLPVAAFAAIGALIAPRALRP